MRKLTAHLTLVKIFCWRQSVQQCASWGPTEFIPQRIAGTLRRGQTTAPRDEGFYLAARLSHIIETFDRQKMIDARVQPDFIQHGDASFLGSTQEKKQNFNPFSGEYI